MEMLRVDMGKVAADLEAAATEVQNAERNVVTANQKLREAQQHHQEIQNLVRALGQYAADEPGSDSGSEKVEALRLAGPLSGLSGMQAARRFVEMRPGQQMRLQTIFAAMTGLGFVGSENAVAVAFADLAKNKIVNRLKRGHYAFPDTGRGLGDPLFAPSAAASGASPMAEAG